MMSGDPVVVNEKNIKQFFFDNRKVLLERGNRRLLPFKGSQSVCFFRKPHYKFYKGKNSLVVNSWE